MQTSRRSKGDDTVHPKGPGKRVEDAAILNKDMRLYIDAPTPRSNEAKMPHCKIYNPMMELTTVRARERVCTYGIPVAIYTAS